MPAMPYMGKYLRDRYEDLDGEKAAMVEARLQALVEKRAGWGESMSNAFDNALTTYAPSSVVGGVNAVRKGLGFQPAMSNESRQIAANRAAAPATPAQAATPKPAQPAPAFQAPKPAATPTMPKMTGAAPAAAPAPATPKAPSFGKKPVQK
jgi:hypothetical protein